MTGNGNRYCFNGLSPELVDEMLVKSSEDIGKIFKPFTEIIKNRDKLREHFVKNGIIKKISESSDEFGISVSGISGFSGTRDFLSSEFACAAAFGMTESVTNIDNGDNCRILHKLILKIQDGNGENASILNALKLQLEIELAAELPGEIILSGHSPSEPFTTAIYNLRNAFDKKDSEISREFIGRLKNFLSSVKALAGWTKNEKILAGIISGNKSRVFLNNLNWASGVDDSTFFSLILDHGEYTTQITTEMKDLETASGIPIKDEKFSSLRDSIASDYRNYKAFYFRPREWTKALRIETDEKVYLDNGSLSKLLVAIKSQCCAPGIKIPYPLQRAGEMAEKTDTALTAAGENLASVLANQNPDVSSELFRFLNF